ncbi:tensin-3 isoform X2 [Brachyhypopomus gauderio]|uniref:tensin-3 isoform X2 n=1 Tax=Brachyhypopomus gauderio TaxID=698409 RepID=UPI00404334EF
MEEGYELDLTYVTERIIAVSFPQACSEDTYLNNLKDVTRMLKSKHADNYLVINLSEKREDLTKMNPKTLDTGWPDLHAPQLDKICTICKTMENWLHSDPQHVVVIHCRGGKGRIGVVISSFVYFTDISASADQALGRFAMRKFYDDKVSALMTPSQKRYVWILNSLLSGSMKMNTSPLFLHCILLHGIPNFDNSGVCRPYVKVYQGIQTVYSSGVYHIGPGHRHRVCIVLEPAQLLKGDIMVKCYHTRAPSQQEVIFRLQFHTGAVQNHNLMFEKEDMEQANKDPRFPDYGKVELVFSEGPERIQGAEHWQNGTDVSVDYSATSSLTRWDSYQDLCNGDALSLQPQVTTLDKFSPKRNQGSSITLGRVTRTLSVTSSPEHSDHALSASSDSGLSSASLWTERTAAPASRPAGPSQREQAELNQLLSGFGLDELRVDHGPEHTSGTPHQRLLQPHLNGGSRPKDRETDILDDEVLMSGREMHRAESLGTLSSSCHQSSQNSLLSDGFCSAGPGEDVPHHAPATAGDHERPRNGLIKRTVSLPAEAPASAPTRQQQFRQGGYSTQTWVQQQQMVTAPHYSYLPEEGGGVEASCYLMEKQAVPNKTTSDERLGTSPNLQASPGPENEKTRDEEFNSLTVDIDNSIDQLNRLILDLDPTFVPIPTRNNSVKRHGGSAVPAQSKSGLTLGLDENIRKQQSAVPPGENGQPLGGRPAWGLEQEFGNRVTYPHSIVQRAPLCRSDSVEYRGTSGLDSDADSGTDPIPTPAFPISPPTPYVKTMPDFSHFARTPSPSMPMFAAYRTENEMRAYADIMGHDETTVKNSHRLLSRANTTGPILSLANSSAQPSCPEGALLTRHTSIKAQHSGAVDFNHGFSHPPSGVGAHSSPPGQRTRVVHYDLSRSPQRDFDEMDGGCRPAGHPGFTAEPDGPTFHLQLPPLPEKRRASDCDHSLGSASPAPSGFSSPHSGSSLSIPFPSVLPELQARGAGVSPPSPLPDVLVSKQVTVKFVQDTSKYWYKPDIARDQAIAVLKDKEPGSFIVRDSHSFKGAYGLAMKVASPPPTVLHQSKKASGDLSSELVRHFLIECTPRGVRLKGCPNEPYFGSLTALVCQHSITPLALPCKLIIPDKDPLEDAVEAASQSVSNSATELLKQGAACNVWFLGSVEMESLTGSQAVQKATTDILSMDPPVTSTVVHFKVSSQGITLTDNQRKLFFRRHYAVCTVLFCALDPQGRKWRRESHPSAKIFGFVARKAGSTMDNQCHLFAEHDPEQPASAIVNFVSKVMIGSRKTT